MDTIDYINNLKNLKMRPEKIKIKEHILLEENATKKEIKENIDIIKEIFVQSSEIEALPSGNERDMQILRLGIIAELDASNLYEKLASLAKNSLIKKLLLDISREEKVHVGELEAVLKDIDPDFDDTLGEGDSEVEDMKK